MKSTAEQADPATPTSSDERFLLDDTTPTTKTQSFVNNEGDTGTSDDTDLLSQEIA